MNLKNLKLKDVLLLISALWILVLAGLLWRLPFAKGGESKPIYLIDSIETANKVKIQEVIKYKDKWHTLDIKYKLIIKDSIIRDTLLTYDSTTCNLLLENRIKTLKVCDSVVHYQSDIIVNDSVIKSMYKDSINKLIVNNNKLMINNKKLKNKNKIKNITIISLFSIEGIRLVIKNIF